MCGRFADINFNVKGVQLKKEKKKRQGIFESHNYRVLKKKKVGLQEPQHFSHLSVCKKG